MVPPSLEGWGQGVRSPHLYTSTPANANRSDGNPMNQQIIAAQPETIPAPPAAQRRWTLALGLYSITSNSLFSNAIWLIYLAAYGYTPFQIGLFETLFHIAQF